MTDVYTHEDDSCVTLQIELENDYAITLTAWKEDGRCSVALWHGSGEHGFEDGLSAKQFEEWIRKAGITTAPPSEDVTRCAIR